MLESALADLSNGCSQENHARNRSLLRDLGKSQATHRMCTHDRGIEQFSDRRSHEFSVVHSAGFGLAGGRSGQITWGLRDSSSDFSSFHPDEFCVDPCIRQKTLVRTGQTPPAYLGPSYRQPTHYASVLTTVGLNVRGTLWAGSRRQPKVGK